MMGSRILPIARASSRVALRVVLAAVLFVSLVLSVCAILTWARSYYRTDHLTLCGGFGKFYLISQRGRLWIFHDPEPLPMEKHELATLQFAIEPATDNSPEPDTRDTPNPFGYNIAPELQPRLYNTLWLMDVLILASPILILAYATFLWRKINRPSGATRGTRRPPRQGIRWKYYFAMLCAYVFRCVCTTLLIACAVALTMAVPLHARVNDPEARRPHWVGMWSHDHAMNLWFTDSGLNLGIAYGARGLHTLNSCLFDGGARMPDWSYGQPVPTPILGLVKLAIWQRGKEWLLVLPWRTIFILLGTLTLVLLILVLAPLIKAFRFTLRLHAGHCPDCGYDLRASPSHCPECGRPVTQPRSS